MDARDESEAFERKQQVAGRTDAAWQGQTAEDSSGGASMFARAADAASSAAASIAGMAGSMLGQGAEVAATGFETAKAAVISTVQGGEGAAAAEERELQEGEEAPMSSQLAAGGGGEGLATSTTTTTTTAVPALQQPLSAQRPVVHHMPAVPANTAADRAAAVTTAAVLPSSAVSPAATGRGYFPTVGAVAETPRPGPRPSGDLEARRVVAERLEGLAEEAAPRRTHAAAGPATPPVAGAARTGRGGAGGMDEDWISELVEHLWPYVKVAVEQMAWEMLPDILEASEPSWIHDINLKKFVLGSKEPDLSNIRVFADDSELMDDAYLEFDFAWHSQTDVELEIQVLPGSMDKAWIPNFIEDKLKELLTFSVGVEDAKLKGRVRVTLRPLLMRVPVVGAMQVSLLEAPEFDFDMTLGDSSNVPMEPALKSWIKQTLQDTVFKTYVLPEHYFLQIDPEAQDLECPTGVLLLEIVEATKVPRMDLLTSSSPYVELYARTSQRRLTSTKSHTKHPRWHESFELPIHTPDTQELTLTLFDYDWASANDEIGRATLKIADLPPGQSQDLWLDVGSQGEEEMAAAKQDMGKRQRAEVAAAKPFTKRSTKKCKLHVKATYLAFTDAEEKLIVQGRKQGMRRMLDSPQGRQMSPHLRNLMLSGSLVVRVPRADNLPVSSLIGRPSVGAVVSVGNEKKDLPSVKTSKGGCVAFDQPVELHLGAEATQSPASQLTVELREGGLFGAGPIGRVNLPLADIIRRGTVKDSMSLRDGGRVQVEAEWKPYF